MIYAIKQATRYDYAEPVTMARQVVRLAPVDGMEQRVVSHTLEVTPAPSEQVEDVDFFGNLTVYLGFAEPFRELSLSTSSVVYVERVAPARDAPSPTAREVTREVFAARNLGPRSPVHRVFPSRMVPIDAAITAFAAESFKAPETPVLEGAVHLMHRIKRDFVYEPGATDVTTKVTEAFAARRGVCQDFAHVMIAGLRGLGLAAGYVSGYLRTRPPPGKPRLEGADASHAWVEVYAGEELGWVGLDPTNDLVVGDEHIVIATGMDYADVAPVDGVIVTAGDHGLEVAVDVVPIGGREASTTPA